MNNLISIIMPSFNSEKTIAESIESVLLQTYENWELLITDDCSSDDTILIINAFISKDHRIKLFQNTKNSGAAISRNVSLSNARGEFIAFLDSDDIWLPNKLEIQLSYMLNRKNVDFSFTAYEIVDECGNSTSRIIDRQGENLAFNYFDMLRKKATLGCSTVLFRREAFEDYLMPNIRTGQDYALWLKLLKTGKNAYLINEVLTKYRILPNSISRNKFKKCKRQWQIYRSIEQLGFYDSLISFIFYAWRAIFRR
ncbi:glycosyltransferase [Escherichia albertii]|uniref:glycosyltransferase family 2 protein n=1 Tax=Escherichia albertii TaxID=208962 RepID=UPI002362B867|nr:glycosyltransferase [Escherichia albertii]WDB75971.1 glycosyltransferase [Escherichia albertii]